MNTAAKNILASLYVHSARADKSGSFSRPTITKAAALKRVETIIASNAYQANGLAGLKETTRDTLEALLAYVGAFAK